MFHVSEISYGCSVTSSVMTNIMHTHRCSISPFSTLWDAFFVDVSGQASVLWCCEESISLIFVSSCRANEINSQLVSSLPAKRYPKGLFYMHLTALHILKIGILWSLHLKCDVCQWGGKKTLTVKTGKPILATSFSFWESTIFLDPAL